MSAPRPPHEPPDGVAGSEPIEELELVEEFELLDDEALLDGEELSDGADLALEADDQAVAAQTARRSAPPPQGGHFEDVAEAGDAGQRLDRFLAQRHPEFSRTRIAALIAEGQVQLDGRSAKPSERLLDGAVVTMDVPGVVEVHLEPEAIPLVVRYEDEFLLVLEKPAGMVVHPGAGAERGTLAAALLHHAPQVAGVGGAERSGLVHRLDKGTTGLMVVAKDDATHRALKAAFAAREVEKLYHAIVWGRPRESEGAIDLPIGRDPKNRLKMSTHSPLARAAASRYVVAEEVPGFALVEVRILTGRTHQVRVHLAAIGHPLVGDETYGGARAASVADPQRRAVIRRFERPALHAAVLGFTHPQRGETLRFESRWPADLRQLWSALGGRPR